MESPTRLSQSRFFRFGRLSKASRKSSSAYSNHSFSMQPSESGDPNLSVAESSYAASEIIYQQLNHRSVSMGTLPPPGIPSGSPSLIYSETNNHVRAQPRLSQLQNLEAKMASIAVSLSGGRRTTGSLPHHGASLRTCASTDAIKPTPPSTKSNDRSRMSKQLRNELELMRKIIQEKDALIHSLQQQQQQRERVTNNMSGQHATPNGTLDRASANERQQIERRLQLINHDIETKRVAIKELRMTLQQTNVSDNIDSRIKQAETEYQLEREETNLLNLQDEKRSLLLQVGNRSLSSWANQGSVPAASSLFRTLNGDMPWTVILARVDYDLHSPCFKINFQHGNETMLSSCTIQWAREDVAVKPGDKVLEINGCYVPGQEKIDVINRLISGSIDLVVARPNREENYLFQIQELSNKIESLTQEREALKGDNIRLKHRISYLEEVQRDENLIHEELIARTNKQKEDQFGTYDSQPSRNKPPIHRSEVRIQQSRQKPPRTSKLKAEGSTNTLSSHQSDSEPDHLSNKRLHSSLDASRAANEELRPSASPMTSTLESAGKSSSRIKSSIVDRHFGHVIRVTHHHHPPVVGSPSLHNQQQYANSVSDVHSVRSFDSFVERQSFHAYQTAHSIDNGSAALTLPKANQRSAPSPTQSEIRSDVSIDLEHHGYVSDDHAISSSISNYGSLMSAGKKTKPVPPRKPSFLYLNRASSLQSVNGSTTSSLSRSDSKGKQKHPESANGSGSKSSSIRAAMSNNLKWNNIFPSASRNKTEAAIKEREA